MSPTAARPGFATRFASGFGLLFRGFREAYGARRRNYALVPLVLNVVLFIVALWFVFAYSGSLVETVAERPEAWYWRALYWFVETVVSILLAYLAILLFPVLGAIVAAPFLDHLSEKLEIDMLGRDDRPRLRLMDMIGDVFRALSHALKGLALGGLCAGVLLIINLLPGLGSLIYIIGNAILAALFFSLEFMDYSAARRRLSYGAKLRILFRDTAGSLGLGLAIFFAVPFLSVVLLAPAACGGTLLFLRTTEGAEAISPTTKG
jgi:CysZ protein